MKLKEKIKQFPIEKQEQIAARSKQLIDEYKNMKRNEFKIFYDFEFYENGKLFNEHHHFNAQKESII